MKRPHPWILTALLFVACGGDDGAGPDNEGNNNSTTPKPTPVGVPNGSPTTQTIGAGGGTVTSSDGLFSITVPPGALTSAAASLSSALETDITIQPITNTAWGGVGPAYRLLPDGLTFAEPVEVTFSLEDSLLAGSDSAVVDIARQNADGLWGILKHRRLDWETRTLTCTTSHLSDYAITEGVQIRPASVILGVKAARELRVRYCEAVPINGDADLGWWIADCSEDVAPFWLSLTNWSVNGVPGGNSTVGHVAPTSDTPVTYTAPEVPPITNPVAVSVRAEWTYDPGPILLVANITITSDAYTGRIFKRGVDNGYDEPDTTVWEVSWTSNGSYYGVETLTGTGTVTYTMVDQFDCPHESITPNSGTINPAETYIVIDRNVDPPTIVVWTSAEWDVRECHQCFSDPEYCEDYLFRIGFADCQATISSDGRVISGSSPPGGTNEEIWSYEFTRPAP